MLRVASWNIHRGVGTDGRHDPARTASVVTALNADVLALQEVDSHPEVEKGLDQLDYLARETRMQAVRGPTLRRSTGDYGNAILTTLPVLDVARHNIRVGRHEPRGILHVDLQLDDEPIAIVATHLGLNIWERRRQTAQLMRVLESIDHRLVIVMGDFNEWRAWGYTRRMLARHIGRGPQPPTWHALMPLFALDRILVRPEFAIRSIAVHRDPRTVRASDHLPIVGVVEGGAHRRGRWGRPA